MSLIQPRLAAAVAGRVAGARPPREVFRQVRTLLAEAVPRAEDLVAEASGIPHPGPTPWDVLDRPEWVLANIRGMTELLEPLARKVEARMSGVPFPARLAQQGALSVEVGILMGYVSRRVLGQYDLMIPEEERSAVSRRRVEPSLYFVAPNIAEIQKKLGFVPADFTLWIALHEVTHRFQFQGVPWLRGRFLDLVHGYLGSVDLDARGLARRLARAARRLASPSTPVEERNPAYLLASDEQRSRLDEVQALMAVVEGHGNFIMDTAGRRVIPSFPRMRSAFQQRKQQMNVAQRAVNYALGIDMKLRQYELGQQFCEKVFAEGGAAGLAALWEAPDRLPTLAELREPRTWMLRVA